jgi:PAS domain S-box-containing protein
MKPSADQVRANRSRRSSGGDVALLASIVDSSDDAIVSKTLDGVITSWNRAAEEMYGYTAEEIIGESIALLSPQDSGEMDEILGEIGAGERVDHYQTKRLKKDGSAISISLTIADLRPGWCDHRRVLDRARHHPAHARRRVVP